MRLIPYGTRVFWAVTSPPVQSLPAIQRESFDLLGPFPTGHLGHERGQGIAVCRLQFIWLASKTLAPDFLIADIVHADCAPGLRGVAEITDELSPAV